MSDWDDDKEYGLEEGSWASSDGFSEWEGDSDLNEGDATDAWLAAKEEAYADEKAEDAPDYGYGGSTAGNLQLERFNQMGEGVKQAAQQILESNRAFGGKSKLEVAAIRERFGETIGGDPAAWAKQLNVEAGSDITRINPRTGKKSKIGSGPGTRDINMAISMLSSSADDFLERGPGGALVGNFGLDGQRSERQIEQIAKANDDLARATSIFNKYAELYIHDSTRENNPELYEMRKGFVSEQLMKRAMEGVFNDTSNAIVPLPNEVGVKGLKPTLSGRGYMGTSFDRVSFRQEAAKRGWSENDNEYWENMPSAKRSLFRLNSGASEAEKDWQAKQFSTMVSELHEARAIIRAETPTTRDETAGQIRMSGFDRPYDEQANIADLRNEASILGLDWQQEETSIPRSADLRFSYNEYQESMDPVLRSMGKLRGSDRSTAHRTGMESLSEVDYFVEQNLEAKEEVVEVEGIPQRTPEWYAARKKIITASTLTDKDGKSLTPAEMAVELAERREGFDTSFLGNAYTRAGVEGEAVALQAFLNKKKKEGDELTHTDVGLLINEDMPGMGVSPDGRLSRDGKNAGLLELKYLTTNAMNKDPVGKYYRQMQMQMLVTGEKETNFFALDQYTGDSIHEVVKADPKYQKALKADIDEANRIAAGLTTATEIDIMAKQTAAQRKAGSPAGSGQQTPFKLEPEGVMIPYRPGQGPTSGKETGLADAHVRQYEALNTAQMNAEAMEESSEATNEAAESTRNFSKELSNAASRVGGFVNALGKIADVVMQGNDTAMDSIRFAAETGMDVKTARGIEFGLQESGGLTLGGARSVMGSAADTVKTYGDVTKLGRAYTDLATRGAGQGISVPSLDTMRGFDGQQLISYVQGEINNADSPQDKMRIARLYGMPELAASKMSAAELMAAEGTIDEDGQRRFYDGRKEVELGLQTMKESVAGVTGETGGNVAAAASATSTALSFTGGVAASAGAATMLKGASASKAASGAAKFAKAGGVLGLATAATTEGIRYAGDIKDDGGTGDTVMDMLEFTAYGASTGALLGSVIPGLGTAIGGVVGAGAGALIGAGNEVYEAFSDTAVPDTNIDPTGTPSALMADKTNVTNNIDVNVEVSKDMVSTEVDVDGDTYMDTEQGYGT